MAEAPLRTSIELAQGRPGAVLRLVLLPVLFELVQGRTGAKTAMPPLAAAAL
jgi:hypothetical protein